MSQRDQGEQIHQEEYIADNQNNNVDDSEMQNQDQNIQAENYMQQQQYNYEPQYQDIMESDYMNELARQPSYANKQYQISELTTNIMQQVEKINQQTNLGFDWSILLYNACGWKSDLCRALLLSVDEKTKQPTQKHKKFIHYTDKYLKNQGDIGLGECMVCGEENKKILRNFCGDEFCIDCWKYHFIERLQTQFRDPFPPCMNDRCEVKMSYSLCRILCDSSPEINSKFLQVLCRSYATYNKSVKMCKGRPGVTCRKCFAINKMFDVIECSTCGNFVCPRCGEQNHGSAECFMINSWKKLTQNSTQFVEYLDYKMCPNCKQVVERKQGCNSIICKCKQQFCYVCGQKWLPNHSAHGDQTCPKYKQIKVLNQQKKKRKQNSKQYYEKVLERNCKYQSIYKQFQRADDFKRKMFEQIKSDLMKNFMFFDSQLNCIKDFTTFLQKSLCVLAGQTLSLHFKQDKSQQFFYKRLQQNIEEINNFIFQHVQKMCRCLKKQQHLLTAIQKEFISSQGKKKFYQQFPNKVKQIKQLIEKTQQIIESMENINN